MVLALAVCSTASAGSPQDAARSLQANDYLQSVSSETRSRGLAGREVKAGLKIQ